MRKNYLKYSDTLHNSTGAIEYQLIVPNYVSVPSFNM